MSAIENLPAPTSEAAPVARKTKTLPAGSKARGAALALPGFVWYKEAAPISGPLNRAMAAIGDMPESEARHRFPELDGTPGGGVLYSGAAVAAALAVVRDAVVKDDGLSLTVEYRGAVWFSCPSAFLTQGVPERCTPTPEAVDVLSMTAATLSAEVPEHAKGDWVAVSVSLTLHGLPTGRLARTALTGYVMRFSDVGRIGAQLLATKYGLAPDMVPALEIEVAGIMRDQALSLWYPASNDDTAKGYGVTVSTDPHAAGVARRRAAVRLEAMRQSQEGAAVTVAERHAETLTGTVLDPEFRLIVNASALPEPGWRHVAHFAHGTGGGLRPITSGAPDFRAVVEAARAKSDEPVNLGRHIEVYELSDSDGGISYVWAAAGSGRVIAPGVSGRLMAAFLDGQSVYSAAPEADAPAPAAAPDLEPVAGPSGVYTPPLDSIPPRPNVAPPEPEAPLGSEARPYRMALTLTPLDLGPVARLYRAAVGLLDGRLTLAGLADALDDFEAACKPPEPVL